MLYDSNPGELPEQVQATHPSDSYCNTLLLIRRTSLFFLIAVAQLRAPPPSPRAGIRTWDSNQVDTRYLLNSRHLSSASLQLCALLVILELLKTKIQSTFIVGYVRKN
jgi:hypothetical protein